MEADDAPFTPLPLSVLRFTGVQSYGYTDHRKVDADVEVTEDRTGDLSLRKPRTSQLSHDCFLSHITQELSQVFAESIGLIVIEIYIYFL